MKSWNSPALPALPGRGGHPRMFDTTSGTVRPLTTPNNTAQLYVCGITPYDATHLGHAATYLAYDTLGRALRDAGVVVRYVQNVTDVDDPLLERATATGVNWRDLAEAQIDLYRSDMEALRIIAPDHYIGVIESVTEIGNACATLLDSGLAYWVDSADAAPDLYFDIAAAENATGWRLGDVSGLDRTRMLPLFAERGGDPERPGKRNQLDPLLWRAERTGEPAWDSPVGRGRPGWHLECSVIGLHYLTAPITLNGGGNDLAFPHHEFSAAHSTALSGTVWSPTYNHAGMVGYGGEKMSKSRGNLVFVSRLLTDGVDPRAIRLALLNHHYRSDWEWSQADLTEAQRRLLAWDGWAQSASDDARTGTDRSTGSLLEELRTALADDLDTPAGLAAIDARVAAQQPPNTLDLLAIEALLGLLLTRAK